MYRRYPPPTFQSCWRRSHYRPNPAMPTRTASSATTAAPIGTGSCAFDSAHVALLMRVFHFLSTNSFMFSTSRSFHPYLPNGGSYCCRLFGIDIDSIRATGRTLFWTIRMRGHCWAAPARFLQIRGYHPIYYQCRYNV